MPIASATANISTNTDMVALTNVLVRDLDGREAQGHEVGNHVGAVDSG